MNYKHILKTSFPKPKLVYNKLANYLVHNPKVLVEYMNYYKTFEHQKSQRASWLLTMVVKKDSNILKPYTQLFISQLKDYNLYAGVRRNLLNVFKAMPIKSKYLGELMSICFDLLLKKDEPVAVKANCLSILENMLNKYPEIGHEIKMIVNEQLPYATAAYKSRAKGVLKKINTL